MKVDGKILTEALGELHIQNDAIALGEQIKNAIDAGASKIVFDFTELNTKKVVTIFEDGKGLNEQEFSDEWNSLGNSSKKDNDELLGGKGIGRFALFRLSKDIDLYCKKSGEIPIHQKMLYEEIEKYDDISEFDFSPTKVEEKMEVLNFEHGTYTKLNNVEKINLTSIQKELKNFNLPFTKNKIEIECKYPNDFARRSFMDPEIAVKYAPFNLTAIFNNGKFEKCECLVRGTEGQKLKSEVIDLEALNSYVQDNLVDVERDFDIDQNCLLNIGEISVHINNFFFDRSYMKKSKVATKDMQENFLYSYQGINIYRNGIKLFGFGGNDFLKLAEERLKRSGDNIDNKHTFGYVIIGNNTKEKLIEKTDREGFVNNDYYKLLMLILENLVFSIGDFRKLNKSLILNDDGNGGDDDSQKPFLNIKNELKILVKNRNREYIEQQVLLLVKSSINTNILFEELDIKVDMTNYQPESLNNQILNIEILYKIDATIRAFTIVEVVFNKSLGKKERALLYVDSDLIARMTNKKLSKLLNEISNLNVYQYPNGCAFLLRSIIEISFNQFIKKNQSAYQLRVTYDAIKEEIVASKDNKIAKAKDRISAVIWIIEQDKAPVLTTGKLDIIISNIEKINFTIHKNNNFIVPENLVAFYSDIEQILLYVLEDVSR